MAQIRSQNRDDFDVELRWPAVLGAIGLAAVAVLLAVGAVTILAVALAANGVALK